LCAHKKNQSYFTLADKKHDSMQASLSAISLSNNIKTVEQKSFLRLTAVNLSVPKKLIHGIVASE
jgi:hypothetical protein